MEGGVAAPTQYAEEAAGRVSSAPYIGSPGPASFGLVADDHAERIRDAALAQLSPQARQQYTIMQETGRISPLPFGTISAQVEEDEGKPSAHQRNTQPPCSDCVLSLSSNCDAIVWHSQPSSSPKPLRGLVRYRAFLRRMLPLRQRSFLRGYVRVVGGEGGLPGEKTSADAGDVSAARSSASFSCVLISSFLCLPAQEQLAFTTGAELRGWASRLRRIA